MSLKRSMLKAQYEKFCRAWQDEKLFQKIYLADGKPLPEGTHPLGKKPTFKMWVKAMENQKQMALQAPPEKAVEVKDTSWEE
jgi:hypothetical protein